MDKHLLKQEDVPADDQQPSETQTDYDDDGSTQTYYDPRFYDKNGNTYFAYNM